MNFQVKKKQILKERKKTQGIKKIIILYSSFFYYLELRKRKIGCEIFDIWKVVEHVIDFYRCKKKSA